jgi:crotonobetainyl-CoA:carnitine CoA-transferase CaiB-like acyl-CoA transferase
LSTDVAGGFATKLLAMSGLRVVRPLRGDAREAGVSPDHDSLRVYLHAGKDMIRAVEGTPLTALADSDDVVFMTFDRGAYDGFPSAWSVDDLPAGSVQVTTSTFGASGPYSAWRGGPLADWAAGGYLGITGEPGRPPLIGPERLCGYITGYTAAIAAEAAMRNRRRTGQSQRVDISTMESMLSVHQSTFSRLSVGIVRERTGRYTEVYPLVVRPCRDGHVSLGVVTDAEFDRLAIAIGRTDLVVDARFADTAARWENRDALDEELDAFFTARDADEVVEILVGHGVAAAKVVGALEVPRNPQLVWRGFWHRPEILGGAVPMPGDPIPARTTFHASPRSERPDRIAPARDARLPLAGLTVLDFTTFWAGPLATRWLADMGADVIWVQRPDPRAESAESQDNPATGLPRAFHFKMNRNKQGVVLDLKDDSDRETARRLAWEADVLMENFRPGVMTSFGLGPSDLCPVNPRLVYVSLSGFGADGPWSKRRSYGPTIEAASSVEGRTGYLDGEPMRLGHTLPDATGGLAGALAALRGLRERDESGTGGWFDISQLEVYAALAGEDILFAALSGNELPRIGNRSRYGAIQGVFRCAGADEWIAVRLESPGDVERLAALTGLTGLVDAAVAVPRDDDYLEARIAEYMAARDKQRTAALLQSAGLEAFAVLNPAELLADGHLRERGFFVTVPGAGAGDTEFGLPGSPVHSMPSLVDPRGPAPGLGEHTDEVLRRFGLSRATPS